MPKEQIEPVLKKVDIVNPDMYKEYIIGTRVKVLKGPFVGSVGEIENVDIEKGTVTVQITFFGRHQLKSILLM